MIIVKIKETELHVKSNTESEVLTRKINSAKFNLSHYLLKCYLSLISISRTLPFNFLKEKKRAKKLLGKLILFKTFFCPSKTKQSKGNIQNRKFKSKETLILLYGRQILRSV